MGECRVSEYLVTSVHNLGDNRISELENECRVSIGSQGEMNEC